MIDLYEGILEIFAEAQRKASRAISIGVASTWFNSEERREQSQRRKEKLEVRRVALANERRYEKSSHGCETRKAYENSESGRTRRKRYYDSDSYRERKAELQRRYRERKKVA